MSAERKQRDLPCLACGVMGREGRDVMFKIVEVPPDERREVAVLLPEYSAHDSLQMTVTVPERYVTEPRCRDEAACHRRVLAHAVATSPPPAPAPEPEPAAPAPAEPESPPDPPAEPTPEYVL